MLDTHGIIYVLRLITSASDLTTFKPCYTIQTPALLARDESQQPSRRNGAGFVLSSEGMMGQLNQQLLPGFGKACTRCKKIFDLDMFCRDKSRADGLHRWCRGCLAKRHKKYYRKNAKVIIARTRNYTKEHWDRFTELRRSRLEHHRLLSRKSYARNSERHLMRARERRKEAPLQHRQYMLRRSKRIMQAGGKFTRADVQRQYEVQHGNCFYCGIPVDRRFHVDHYIPLAKGGSNGPDNIVIACPKCNLRKSVLMPEEFMKRLNDV